MPAFRVEVVRTVSKVEFATFIAHADTLEAATALAQAEADKANALGPFEDVGFDYITSDEDEDDWHVGECNPADDDALAHLDDYAALGEAPEDAEEEDADDAPTLAEREGHAFECAKHDGWKCNCGRYL